MKYSLCHTLERKDEQNLKHARLIALLLAMIVSVSVTGCSGAKSQPTQATSSSSASEAAPAPTPEPTPEPEPVVFTDKTLEELICKELGKTAGSLTADDVEGIRSITILGGETLETLSIIQLNVDRTPAQHVKNVITQ